MILLTLLEAAVKFGRGRHPKLSAPSLCSAAETPGRIGNRLGAHQLAIARRCLGDKRADQHPRSLANLFDRKIECGFVHLRGAVEAAELTHKLQRGGRISSSVAGGSKLKRVFIFRHMVSSIRRIGSGRNLDNEGLAVQHSTIRNRLMEWRETIRPV